MKYKLWWCSRLDKFNLVSEEFWESLSDAGEWEKSILWCFGRCARCELVMEWEE